MHEKSQKKFQATTTPEELRLAQSIYADWLEERGDERYELLRAGRDVVAAIPKKEVVLESDAENFSLLEKLRALIRETETARQGFWLYDARVPWVCVWKRPQPARRMWLPRLGRTWFRCLIDDYTRPVIQRLPAFIEIRRPEKSGRLHLPARTGFENGPGGMLASRSVTVIVNLEAQEVVFDSSADYTCAGRSASICRFDNAFDLV